MSGFEGAIVVLIVLLRIPARPGTHKGVARC